MSVNPEYFFPTLITNITSLNGGVLGTVKATDVYPAVDITDQSQAPSGTTKPYNIQSLINFILTTLSFNIYAPVLASTTASLTATYNNGVLGVGATLTNSGAQVPFAVDGQTGIVNGRYLIKNEANAAYNGIYVLTNIGSSTSNWVLTRSNDFNQAATSFYPPNGIVEDGIVYVQTGTSFGNTYWQDSYSAPLVVGTTNINWTQWQFAPAEVFWQVVTVPSVNAEPNNGYITNRASQVQVLLPAIFNIGDEVLIRGLGTGGWALLTNTGQTIQFGSLTANTSIESNIQYSNITVRGIVPNTTWTVDFTNENPQVI